MFCNKCSIWLISLLLLSPMNLIFSMEIVKNRNTDWDYGDIKNGDKGSCLFPDDRSCKNYFENDLEFLETVMKRKPNQNAASTLAAFQDVDRKETRIIPYYHSAHPMPCSCGMEFRLQDLGHSYYPRYIHTGVCKSEGCGGLYHCVEKHYKVRVLKQRNPSVLETPEAVPLPESLRDFWKSDVVSVTVACECSL